MTSLVNRASVTTIPIGVDDICTPGHIENLAVQFFNGADHSTISGGANHPRTGILLTSNKHFAKSSR